MPSRASRSGVGEVLCALLAVAGAVLTVATAAVAFKWYRSDGNAADLALILVPLLITATFAGVAMLLDAQRRQDRRIAQRQTLNPDEPWLWTDRWRDGRVRAESSWGPAIAIVVFAAFWNGMIGVAAIALYRQGQPSAPGPAIMLSIFGVVGLGLIVAAVYLVLAAKKYSPALFEMSDVPGVLGGHLLGWVRVPAKVPPGTDATIDVSCVRWNRNRGKSSASFAALWRDQTTATVTGDGSLPVSFTIPFELPPSELPERAHGSGGSRISWLLSISASLQGVDYNEVFEVPVFATAASDRTIVAGAVDLSSPVGPPSSVKASLVEAGPERTAFEIGPAKGILVGVSVFVILPLAAWAIPRFAGANVAASATAAGIALAVGGVILVFFVLGVAMTVTRLEIDAEAIRVIRGKSLLRWVRTIPLAGVKEVKYQSGETQYVVVLTHQGTDYWASNFVSNPEEAKWLATELARAVERHRPQAAGRETSVTS